jgi:malate synthase
MSGVDIAGPSGDRFDEILTPDALSLIAALHRELGARSTAGATVRRSNA